MLKCLIRKQLWMNLMRYVLYRIVVNIYLKPILKVCIIYRVPFVVKFMFSLTNIVSVTPDTPTD